jgi:hypothetical protein
MTVAGSGPTPNPASRRQSGNQAHTWTDLPANGYDGPIPEWPLGEPSFGELSMWERYWRKPQAAAWARMQLVDEAALYVRAFLLGARGQRQGDDRGSADGGPSRPEPDGDAEEPLADRDRRGWRLLERRSLRLPTLGSDSRWLTVPWRGPEYDGEFPSLGWLVGEWIESHCVIPDREHGGEPYMLTDEMWTFLAHHYRLKLGAQDGQLATAFAYRRSILVRPQKWGKGPLTAALICAEAIGPTVFAGFDADGEPVGKPRQTPRIQIAATTDDQTGNVYGHLVPMIQRGPLADLIPDAGLTRVLLPDGGKVEPVTSKASRLGAPISFAVMDETGIWTRENKGHDLAKTLRRGLAGMGGRSVETTNAWNPAELSTAQMGYEAKAQDIYRDYRPPPAHCRTATRPSGGRSTSTSTATPGGSTWTASRPRLPRSWSPTLRTPSGSSATAWWPARMPGSRRAVGEGAPRCSRGCLSRPGHGGLSRLRRLRRLRLDRDPRRDDGRVRVHPAFMGGPTIWNPAEQPDHRVPAPW